MKKNWSSANSHDGSLSIYREGNFLGSILTIRVGKKKNWTDLNMKMVVGGRRAGLTISKSTDLLGFSHTTICGVYWECSPKEKIPSEQSLCGEGKKSLLDVRGQNNTNGWRSQRSNRSSNDRRCRANFEEHTHWLLYEIHNVSLVCLIKWLLRYYLQVFQDIDPPAGHVWLD